MKTKGGTAKSVLAGLVRTIQSSVEVEKICTLLQKGDSSVDIVRTPGSLRSFVTTAVIQQLSRPLLYVAPDVRTAEQARDDLRTLLGQESTLFLPPLATIPYDPLRQNQRFDERAGVFERLLMGSLDVLITIPATLVERFEDLQVHRERLVEFRTGDEIDREALVMIFAEAGMRREIRAEEPGQFAIRGGVVDIYAPAAEYPVRLELWGDEIVELREYDPATQRSIRNVHDFIFYAGEKKETIRTKGLWEMIPESTLLFIDDFDAIDAELERSWEEILYQYGKRQGLDPRHKLPDPSELFFSKGEVLAELLTRQRIVYRGQAAPTTGAVNFDARSHDTYMGKLDRVLQHLIQFRVSKYHSYILCDRESQVSRLEDMLEDHGASPGIALIGVGSIHGGFVFPGAEVAVFTDHQIFGRHKRTAPFHRRKKVSDTKLLDQLRKGEYVVHQDFGIGRYLGLTHIKVRGKDRECLQVEYQEGVKLYVRLEQFNRLQKYQGTDGAPPKLSRIGGNDWERTQKKAKKLVEDMAKEILELYAMRKIEGGFTFSKDSRWQREMEAAFEFADTPDQASTVEEIKRDMEKPIPMDRLLCGDVGFGKTEVAIRAAFKAVQDSKQVAVLVPTTILAQQHLATFEERLRQYPLRIEMLSRFRTRQQIKRTLEGVASGEVDIVIGTHRLLSKDVVFHDLGLLIIDEEHRFGVKHKDKLKKLRTTVDVLTLTATPIPRTLHMALSGARDMSLISTPPHDRQPIATEIAPFDERIIREAILRETARGGQVYFLHNRVKSIFAIKKMIQRLLPDVRIGVAHGQMKERELETVMEEFLRERYDVLVCTMIIESGLDIPNVNTLIINRADRLGLAQLYQVRGRIGRSHRKAYAYLLTPPRMVLTQEARKRLETVAEHTRLGSGFQIAMRDLEIRGAGNLLGAQQSGSINAVGFEMYTEMLSEAVKQLSEATKTELPSIQKKIDPRSVKVEVGVDAVFPSRYVFDPGERVELYRRLSRMNTLDELTGLRDELRDRYGPLPEQADHLLNIVEVQILCAENEISKLELYEEVAFLYFQEEWGGDQFGERMGELLARLDNFPIEFRGTDTLGLKISFEGCENWQDRWRRLKELVESMN